MVVQLLLRGMLVGVLAGLLAFGFARVFGEPQVDRAIAFEEQLSQAKGEAPEPELVSRPTQAGPGLLTAVVVFGAAIGGLFSLAFAFVHGRVGRFGARTTAALLALAGFVSIVLVPTLKYPGNPPSVGDPETIGSRTALYFAMLVISVAALAFAIKFARGLMARHGTWNAVLAGGAIYVVTIAVAQYVLPAINEVPAQFSADLLWRFRIASLGIHAILWATIGLAFGYLTERALAAQSAGHDPQLRVAR